MNCNFHVLCKLIFSNKFGLILETSLFLTKKIVFVIKITDIGESWIKPCSFFIFEKLNYMERSLSMDKSNLFLILFWKRDKNNNSGNIKAFNQPILIAQFWLVSY
jgi:hypothetical protein